MRMMAATGRTAVLETTPAFRVVSLTYLAENEPGARPLRGQTRPCEDAHSATRLPPRSHKSIDARRLGL
jgi:hypothetical protein